MKKVEILSPVGNMECLKAAVEAGCDAVYLGGNMFGARAFAGNFSNEELVEAIKYAHLYGVKVYLTVNTIIYENEVERFVDYIRFVHKNNIDAIIIQDIGMFDLLRKKFPNLELHASTQMHIHNFEGALLAKSLGFKRIVMARETPIEVIEKIKREIDIEVEVFIHGALCLSYSGQCLASALIGMRSGNRGTCAQICRKKYDLYDKDKNKLNYDNYLLSTKDLCTLEHIDEIIKSGADSLKIEGRMKRPEYVYLVTKIYRKVIENYYETGTLKIEEKDIISLKKIFNRCFTKGFMLGEKNDNFTYEKRPNHKGIEIGTVISKIKDELKIKLTGDVNLRDGLRIIDEKEDKGLVINKMMVNKKQVSSAKRGDIITIKYDKYVEQGSSVLLTTDYNELKLLDEELKTKKRKVSLDAYVKAKIGKPLYIKVFDGANEVEGKSDKKLEAAIKVSTTKDVIEKQINKTGDTVYKFDNITIDMDENIFINIKDINDLRRNVLDKLNKKRLYEIPFKEENYEIDVPSFDIENKTAILIDDKKDLDKVKDKYNIIYSNVKDINDAFVIPRLPRVINKYKSFDEEVLISEFGSLSMYKTFDTDFSFNVVNSYSVAFLHNMGAKRVTLSYELSLKQIENIISSYKNRYQKNPNLEVIIDSYPEAMISKYSLNKKYNVNESYLKDSYGNYYKVKENDGFMTIFHYEKVNNYNKENLYKLGVNVVRKNI